MPTLVPAAARTMTLFEVFARERRPLTNSELARLLDLPESSCSDLVHTLIDCGFLMRGTQSRKVYPTRRLSGLARDIDLNDPLLNALKEACDSLRDKTGETALCGRLENRFVRVLCVSEGNHPLRYTSVAGGKLSVHVSAMGKALLAQLSPGEASRQIRLKPLRPLASGTITDPDRLEEEVELVRQRGWAITENEGGEDLGALAVTGCIDGELVAISVAGPVSRLRAQRETYLEILNSIRDDSLSGSPPGSTIKSARRVSRSKAVNT